MLGERTRQVFHAKEGTITTLKDDTYDVRLDCRVCHARALEPVLDLGVQYLPRFVPEADYGLPKAPLELHQCSQCGLLQLGHTVKPDLLFKEYWYRSSINQTMKTALADIVDHGCQYHSRGSWLDIGANDGYLLSQVPNGFRKVACEPATDFHEALKEQKFELVPTYFSHQNVPGHFDVITSCAVFYDLDDPHRFVSDVAASLSPDGVWVNQLNDAPTMLKKGDFSAVCHEHLTYYDVPTLDRLYREHGLNITRLQFNDVNGGSVRVTARKSSRQREDLLGIPRTKPEEVKAFAARTVKWREVMGHLLTGPLAYGNTYCYGASTKGCVMLQYLDTGPFRFSGVADRNPLKHGLKMVGTWIPICSEGEMRAANPKWVFVLPYAFREEFDAREKELRAAGTTFVYPFPDISFVL